MIDESKIIPELEKQYNNLLDFIDKINLSPALRLELLRNFKRDIDERTLNASYEVGFNLGQGQTNQRVAALERETEEKNHEEIQEEIREERMDEEEISPMNVEPQQEQMMGSSSSAETSVEPAPNGSVGDEEGRSESEEIPIVVDAPANSSPNPYAGEQRSGDESKFSEYEESLISQYANYFRENGVDAPINSVGPLSDRAKEILSEAISRVKSEEKSPTR